MAKSPDRNDRTQPTFANELSNRPKVAGNDHKPASNKNISNVATGRAWVAFAFLLRFYLLFLALAHAPVMLSSVSVGR